MENVASEYDVARRRVKHLHTLLHAGSASGAVALECGSVDGTEDSAWHDGPRSRRFVERYPAPCGHVETLFDNFQETVRSSPAAPFLGTRVLMPDLKSPGPYRWETYSEAATMSKMIGSGLLALGIPTGAHIGLYSANCREWMLCDIACHSYAMVDVPLYDTLGADAVSYITNHAELSAICCSSDVLPTLLESVGETPTLRVIVVFSAWGRSDPPNIPPAPPRAGVPPIRILSLEDVIAIGRSQPSPYVPPTPQTPATICYTSGTTGTPKGVVLTHANMISNSAATARAVQLRGDDVAISYLPLAHIYERVNSVTLIHFGCSIGFYRGDVLVLLEDILELRPTLFSSVPRLWNRIYDKIQNQLNESSVKRMIFQLAFNAGRSALRERRPPPFWTRPIFNALKARLGGRVRLMITGASPLSADVMEFLRVCFGTTIEGYGMTETACTISVTSPDDPSIGHVGEPVRCMEVKLADIPEMRYHNSDKPHPRGEICVRGPSVFSGYHKDPAGTAEVIDSDGWFHTGDVGMRLPGGRLKIIDRKKNIFKLAQGEYVAPEKIENVYIKCPLVAQVMVYGDSLKHKLVAIVVPDPEVLQPWAVGRKIGGSLEELCRNPAVVGAVLKQMLKQGEDAGLNGFEQAFAIHLEPEMWTVESGFMTPTMKIKRPVLREAYQRQIDEMYAKLSSSG